MLTDLNWAGVKRLEADEIALLQNGRAVDIHDAFVNEDQIARVQENTVPVGGGITYTELVWPDISDTRSTWAQEHPGLHGTAELRQPIQ